MHLISHEMLKIQSVCKKYKFHNLAHITWHTHLEGYMIIEYCNKSMLLRTLVKSA